MKGGMRHSQPPTPTGSPTEPVFPKCRIIFHELLEPTETKELGSERLQDMEESANEQTEEICASCVQNSKLQIVSPGGFCPAKDISAAEVAIHSLRLPQNRAYRRRLQHVLTNQGKTKYIPGLDDDTRYAIKGVEHEPRGSSIDEDAVEDPISPQGLTDLRRGVEHEVLKDLGY